MADKPDTHEPDVGTQGAWRHFRVLVSLLLLAHLTVVIATPMAMVTPASPLARQITRTAAPYLQAGNVSHGYAFFAPDPGPSHLIRYELHFADGSMKEAILPDVQRLWPRQLYHRHFMLSEQLASMAVPAEPPPRPQAQADLAYVEEWKQQYADWKIAREQFLERARSYAQHLLKRHGAQGVDLYLIRHELPAAADVLRGRRLDDEASYVPFSRDPVVSVSAEDKT